MSNIVNKLYQNNTIIYKVILFLVATTAIVYFFPKGGQFKYDFSNGQLWKYDNLYAPFDFAIQKNEEEVISNLLLKNQFFILKLPLVQGFNKIDFQALNQGSSGPNTAELRVFDDNGVALAAHKWNLSTGSTATMIIVKEGEDIFGSVTVQDILDNFAAAGIEIAKPSVLLAEPIKKLGAYGITTNKPALIGEIRAKESQ